MTKLKLSTNKDDVLNEISDGKFKLDFDGYILHLKSFISKNQCNQIVSSLKILEKDKSTPYTDGLLNNDADTYFDPDIPTVDEVSKKIFTDGLKIYSERVRAFNWSYYGTESLHYSEMIIRKYNENSIFDYHHDDIIAEIFPHWFLRRQNILTCIVYFNDKSEYTGGKLQFANSDKEYIPDIGDVIIFPANWMYYHKVSKITSGTRYSGALLFYFGSSKKMPNAPSKSW